MKVAYPCLSNYIRLLRLPHCNTTPAQFHPHATDEVVYVALFTSKNAPFSLFLRHKERLSPLSPFPSFDTMVNYHW